MRDHYQQREHTLTQAVADRKEWEQATGQSRRLAVAADAELRRTGRSIPCVPPNQFPATPNASSYIRPQTGTPPRGRPGPATRPCGRRSAPRWTNPRS
jgi:hypothetical protein